ncbi:hypothetical protein THRCLA_21158 [Thraustotheca clavata]|uniref:DDE Tnp4 domain-containing protein n=1 Tax=Thraustotheca clavata TaxID=74557 RepID=A0A1V9ZZM5_9STRA|nr:hypothetical protein THRCLA_21158 [Thraustotheca clavata]
MRGSNRSFEKKVAVFLYFLATEGGYREFPAYLSLGVSTSSHILTNILVAKSIPTTPAEWQEIAREFQKQGIAFIAEAVDGTLVEINHPKDNAGFYNRNGDPSLNIQVVVGYVGRILSVDIRAGSYSDRKIWRASTFGRNIRSWVPWGYFVIGDAG